MTQASDPVVIIGAGVAGLAAARELLHQRRKSLILEASPRIGGRVGGERVDGFILDHGFQVLLPAYPEARRLLDYEALELRAFHAGARIYDGGRSWTVLDPARHLIGGLSQIFHPVAPMRDAPRMIALLKAMARLDDPFAIDDETSREHLARYGLSDTIMRRFFEPFFGGVFFDPDLTTSARMLAFTFSMFVKAPAALPRQGMQAIPDQLAAGLPDASIRLDSPVEQIEAGAVTLASGERIPAAAVIVAADMDAAARLLGAAPEGSPTEWRSTVMLAFDAPTPPYPEPLLSLNGSHDGPVNHLAIPSNVSDAYAPPGRALIYANLVGQPDQPDQTLDADVRAQLRGWFGPEVDAWRTLRILRIPHALPAQPPGVLQPPQREVRVRPGLYVCGDHRDNASINGAMVSGRRAAEAVLHDLPQTRNQD